MLESTKRNASRNGAKKVIAVGVETVESREETKWLWYYSRKMERKEISECWEE